MHIAPIQPPTGHGHGPSLSTPAAPVLPPVLLDHDGTSYPAPCTARYCPPSHHRSPAPALAASEPAQGAPVPAPSEPAS